MAKQSWIPRKPGPLSTSPCPGTGWLLSCSWKWNDLAPLRPQWMRSCRLPTPQRTGLLFEIHFASSQWRMPRMMCQANELPHYIRLSYQSYQLLALHLFAVHCVYSSEMRIDAYNLHQNRYVQFFQQCVESCCIYVLCCDDLCAHVRTTVPACGQQNLRRD